MWRVQAWFAVSASLLVVSEGASTRKQDADFEFTDTDLQGQQWSSSSVAQEHESRHKRYIYDPHNDLCRALVCKKRESCVLVDGEPRISICLNNKELQKAVLSDGIRGPWTEEDVFYLPRANAEDSETDEGEAGCVGCGSGSGARTQFLCGSDNRTYSSLCRLDLHNCVRRPAPPVALACRGFCPCRQRPPRPDRSRRRRIETARNEVLPPLRPHRRPPPTDCALDQLADRLLDWFSVLMQDNNERIPPAHGFPSDCKPEVRWMFNHLDTDGDGELSPANLYSLRHDERERCLRPFLARCGSRQSRAAWCGCLRAASRPCLALSRSLSAPPPPGAYAPSCDARGFYRPRQCHPALGVCWCVDRHGVELPGSRTKGAPACPEPDGQGEAPADDEDEVGSGDSDIRY